jgi:hypothetical protein
MAPVGQNKENGLNQSGHQPRNVRERWAVN